MKTWKFLIVLIFAGFVTVSAFIACGDDDDDDSADAATDDDDDVNDDVDDDVDDDTGGTEYGACCVDGACAVTTYDDCSDSWQGPDTTCDPNPCGDDDLNDDVDDDADDDADDDVDDDADDDVDDDVDDDADDDTTEPTTTTTTPATTTTTTVVTTTSTTTTTMTPPSCEGEQVNNGPLDVDNDGDGYSENIGDCNDANNTANPGGTEVFDGVDNNCDGTIDEGFDEDCDGYLMETLGGDDCDDSDWRVNPDASDDGLILIDLNCDGLIGDAASGDADGDGFAALGTSGGVVDCDDSDFFVFPGNAPLDDPVACMRDEDFDDYGDDQAIAPIIAGTDCDDSDLLSNPGAPELPDDGVDQNCVGGDLILGDDTGVFVATTGDDANSGSMASPKLTINAGANLAALTGKSVFIAAGEYTEDVETEVSLFGGYESTGWTRNIDTNVTTITAEVSTAVKVVETETKAGDATPVAIQGFTINGGSGSSNSYGVYTSGTATLVNNTIDGGSPTGESSESYGVYNRDTMTLVNNTINGGSGTNGSLGVCGATTLVGNTIDGGSGGYSVGVFTAGILVGNTINVGAGSFGSYGVYSIGATLVNNIINGGSEGSSVGVFNIEGAGGTLVNNDIWGADMDCMIFNSGCEANTIVDVNACAWEGCTEASGNISDDPLFVDPDNGDFHLQSDSPCINTGINPVPDYIGAGLVEFDFEGDARPYGAGWDIGVDEWTP